MKKPKPAIKTNISTYRQRGYKCDDCKTVLLVFGRDKPPTKCPNCDSKKTPKLDWDHVIKQTAEVSDFKE